MLPFHESYIWPCHSTFIFSPNYMQHHRQLDRYHSALAQTQPCPCYITSYNPLILGMQKTDHLNCQLPPSHAGCDQLICMQTFHEDAHDVVALALQNYSQPHMPPLPIMLSLLTYCRTGFNCYNLLIANCEFLLSSQSLEMQTLFIAYTSRAS